MGTILLSLTANLMACSAYPPPDPSACLGAPPPSPSSSPDEPLALALGPLPASTAAAEGLAAFVVFHLSSFCGCIKIGTKSSLRV